MIKNIDGSARAVIQECNIVYEYLQQRATIQSPEELIHDFKLLQNGRNADAKISHALEKIVGSSQAQFTSFLSQCLYTILDTWIATHKSLAWVNRLLEISEAMEKATSYDRRRKQLIQQIRSYRQSQSYRQLKSIATIINPTIALATSFDNSLASDESAIENSGKTPLIESYLARYFFIYPYLLPSELSAPHLAAKIQQLQLERQKHFEIELSKHIIYRFRLRQVAKMKMMSRGAGKIITKVENPSLLSERAFRSALQQYASKNDRGDTLLERSQLFAAENKHRKTYEVFKLDFGHFLVDNLKPRNNTYHFKSRLEQKLREIFPQANDKPLNRTQMLQTSRQLLSYLIIDPASANNPQQFSELIANLGTAQVMLILIKIILICPEAKADLEKKLYLITSHYQLQTFQKTPWLLKCLEHLLISYSICLGNIDASLTRAAIAKS